MASRVDLLWLLVLPPSCRGTSSRCPVWRVEAPRGHTGDLERAHPGTGSPLALSASAQPPAPPARPRSPSGTEWRKLGWEWMHRDGLAWGRHPEGTLQLYGWRCPRCPQLAVRSALSGAATWTHSHPDLTASSYNAPLTLRISSGNASRGQYLQGGSSTHSTTLSCVRTSNTVLVTLVAGDPSPPTLCCGVVDQ